MKKAKLGLTVLTMLVFLLSGCTKEDPNTNTLSSKNSEDVITVEDAKKSTENKYGTYDEEDFDESYDESSATKIELKKTSAEIDGSRASEKDNIISITAGGTYII